MLTIDRYMSSTAGTNVYSPFHAMLCMKYLKGCCCIVFVLLETKDT